MFRKPRLTLAAMPAARDGEYPADGRPLQVYPSSVMDHSRLLFQLGEKQEIPRMPNRFNLDDHDHDYSLVWSFKPCRGRLNLHSEIERFESAEGICQEPASCSSECSSTSLFNGLTCFLLFRRSNNLDPKMDDEILEYDSLTINSTKETYWACNGRWFQ